MKSVVYIEMKDGKPVSGSLEALSAAVALGETHAVVFGADGAEQTAPYGVPVIAIDAAPACDDEAAALLEAVVREKSPDTVLFSATQAGKDYAPRLAQRLGGGCVTDAIALSADGDALLATRPAYGGTVYEQLKVTGPMKFATVRSSCFAKPEVGAPTAIETVSYDLPDGAVKAKVIETVTEITEAVDLEGAEVIVAGGLGMGSAEGFKLVEELAALLDGVVGASRPAIEGGWVSRAHQIGQSGKTVAPRLYIACGISGAMQHISGAMGSKYIVAINKDPDASIFKVADVGIVGDALTVLPLLMDEIRARKGL